MSISLFILYALCAFIVSIILGTFLFNKFDDDSVVSLVSIGLVILSVVAIVYGIVVSCNMHYELKSTNQYKITVKDNKFYYSNGEKIVIQEIKDQEYMVSELGYSYYEIKEYDGYWWVFTSSKEEHNIYLDEEDVLSFIV